VSAQLSRGRSHRQWGSGVGLRASTPTPATFRSRRNGWGIHGETELPRHDHRRLHRATPRSIATRGVVPGARRPALSVTSRGSRLSRLSRVSPLKRTSQIRRIARMPLGSRRSRSQRATLINWIARVSLTTRRTRVQRSSRHPRTPRTPRRERPLRRPMVCRVGGFGSASGSLDIISQSSTNRPSPLRFRQTHRITPLVTAFTTSQTGIVHPKPHTVASLISPRSNVPKK